MWSLSQGVGKKTKHNLLIYLFFIYLCIYFALHKKAWHYPFEPVMISKAELISLPFWSLKTLIIFQSFFYVLIFRTASDFF